MPSQPPTGSSKSPDNALLLKLDIQQKHKRALVTYAGATFIMIGIIGSFIFRFIEKWAEDAEHLVNLLQLGFEYPGTLSGDDIIGMITVLPLLFVMLFAMMSLYCTGRAFLVGFSEHVSAINYSKLKDDEGVKDDENEKDYRRYLEQEYKREKISVSEMFEYMQHVSASLICATISGGVFILASLLEARISELTWKSELVFVFYVIFIPLIFIVRARSTSSIAINECSRKLNRWILRLATKAWALMILVLTLFAIFASNLQDAFDWVFVFFILTMILILLPVPITIFLMLCERAQKPKSDNGIKKIISDDCIKKIVSGNCIKKLIHFFFSKKRVS